MDTKDLLAQASAALDAERAASAALLQQTRAERDDATAANVSLQAQLDTASATIASLKAASDPWASVDKTGATDVTDKVQALWAKGLPTPAGKYLIDAVKGLKVTVPVKLDPNAILIAKPNGQPRYCMVDVAAGASITGGQLIGDRDSHDYTTIPGTHEWGYGIFLRGNGAKASNVQVSKCTGDGVGVSGDNCVLDHVTSTGNRRQGLSVFDCAGLRVYDCVFADTNGAPNGPCAGVDFEPDKGSVTDARLERCTSRNNRVGFLGWVGTANIGGKIDVTFVDCNTDNNANGIQGKAVPADGWITFTVQGGTHSNRASDIKADQGTTITLVSPILSLIGKTLSAAQQWAIQKSGTGQVVQSGVVFK